MSVRVEGGGGVATPPNLRLDAEVITIVGPNERDQLMTQDFVLGFNGIQLDIVNPLRIFTVTSIEITVADVAPVATFARVGLLGVSGAIPNTNDGCILFGISDRFAPLQNTVHKISLECDFFRGDTFIFPFEIHDANLTLRIPNVDAGQNRIFAKVFGGDWPKKLSTAWVLNTVSIHFRVFSRRLIA